MLRIFLKIYYRSLHFLEDFIDTKGKLRRLTNALAARSISHVVDIGANRGELFSLIRKKWKPARYIAVEPNPLLVQELQTRFHGVPQFEVFQFAVSDEAGTAILHVDPNFDVLSSLSRPSKDMNPGVDFKEEVEVNVLITSNLLDLLIPENPRARLMLKIDTQGFDYKVLSALGNWWDRVEVIMVELSAIPLYRDAAPDYKVISLLREHNFVPIFFQPITRRNEDGVVLIAEYDGLFVKRK